MIIRIVKLTLRQEAISTFLKHFNSVKEKIRAFPGCSHLELLTEVSNPQILFTYSLWESEEALNQYLNSQLFSDTWIVVKPLFSTRAEAWSLEKLQTVVIS